MFSPVISRFMRHTAGAIDAAFATRFFARDADTRQMSARFRESTQNIMIHAAAFRALII